MTMIYIRHRYAGARRDRHGNLHPIYGPGAVAIAYNIDHHVAQVGVCFWSPDLGHLDRQKARHIAQTRLRTSPLLLILPEGSEMTPSKLVALLRTLLVDQPAWKPVDVEFPHSPTRKMRVFWTDLMGPDGALAQGRAESRVKQNVVNLEGLPRYDGWLSRAPKWVSKFLLEAT